LFVGFLTAVKYTQSFGIFWSSVRGEHGAGGGGNEPIFRPREAAALPTEICGGAAEAALPDTLCAFAQKTVRQTVVRLFRPYRARSYLAG